MNRPRAKLCHPALTAALMLGLLPGAACNALDDGDGNGDGGRMPEAAATTTAGQPATPLPRTPVPEGAVGAPGFRTVLPEGNFRADCSTDADCDQPYSCLQSRAFGVPGRTVCSLPCTIDADCPFAFNEHCGELTLCENGVCSLLGCM